MPGYVVFYGFFPWNLVPLEKFGNFARNNCTRDSIIALAYPISENFFVKISLKRYINEEEEEEEEDEEERKLFSYFYKSDHLNFLWIFSIVNSITKK